MRAALLITIIMVATPVYAQIITPGQGAITDLAGNVWMIQPNGSITEGNIYTPGGGGTSALTITSDGTIYGQDDKSGQWFTLNGGSHWTTTTLAPGIVASTDSAISVTSERGTATLAPVAPPSPAAPTVAVVCASLPAAQTLLPCGPLHTSGSQIVDQQNRPVRLNCTAWWSDSPDPLKSMLTAITAGFNCFRVSYFNASIDHDIAAIDQAVAVAGPLALRIIINNHANEGRGDCMSQQANGLWFDKGPGTDGTDGCGTPGTVTYDRWVSDWVKVATHYKGNQTIIGYDLWNEPFNSTWGGGGSNDILAAYTRAGNAIQAVDSGPLIIAEGPIVWEGLYQEDSRGEKTKPLTLTVPNKVVMSAHLYPNPNSGPPIDHGPEYIALMNEAFGFLITENIAPVWIGEIGASMTSPRDKAWADTVVPYLNGKAPGGIVIPPGGQGVGTDWWMWSCLPGFAPDGALEADKLTPKASQAAVYSQFIQQPLSGQTQNPAVSTKAYSDQATILSTTASPAPPTPAEQPVAAPTTTSITGSVRTRARK
jgi:endoglucanase